MQLIFNSVQEMLDYVAQYHDDEDDNGGAAGQTTGQTTTRRTRRTRAQIEADRAAQAAGQGGQMQQQPGAPQQGFSPAPGGAPQSGFPPAPGTVNFSQQQQPMAHPLVAAIIAKADAAIAGGQPLDGVTAWFRQSLGPEAAQLTWEQIKVAALPKASEPTLANIAKLLNVTG